MIALHQFARVNGLNPSPYCLKVEVYCQLAGVAYKPRSVSPLKSPRGKLPYIVDNGQTIPDSDRIIDHLKKTCGDPLDRELTEGQRAIGHLLKQTLEQSLYFTAVYSRWADDQNWPAFRDLFFAGMPPVLSKIVPVLARRGIIKALRGQGYGRNPEPEIYQTGAADLAAVAWQLQQHPFAIAEQPTSVDATAYAFLDVIVNSPVKTILQESAAKHPAIGAYLERMKNHLASLKES